MNTSKPSLNIIITSNGETAYYTTSKLESYLLVTESFGLYKNSFKPNPFTIFKGVNMSHRDNIKSVLQPVENLQYGMLIINYDTKEITSNNSEIEPFKIFKTWMLSSVEEALRGYSGYIESESILHHIKEGRICHEQGEFLINCTTEPEKFLVENRDVEEFFYIVKPSEWKYIIV